MADSKSILVLGCGLCSPPMIKFFNENKIKTSVASRTLSRAEAVCKDLEYVTPIQFDVEAEGAMEKLEPLVQAHDLIISMLPYIHHCKAARVAIKHKKHFCTTSYVSDEMQTLNDEAKAAGIILLNECGVDPGLDHMSAQKVIDEVHQKGGKIVEFYSICGGLPAPEFNDNPFGYKLSWSPRGVLLASRNSCLFQEKGEKVAIDGVDLFAKSTYRMQTVNGIDYEWYPNRDSVKYKDIYNIPECKTIIRGTFRNKGWCDVMKFLAENNFTSLEEDAKLCDLDFSQLTQKLLKTDKPAKQAVADMVGAESPIVNQLEWLGLFSNERITSKTVLDAMCVLFERKLVYAEGEKDMIQMRHVFEVEYKNNHRETLQSTLIDFGLQPTGDSSMSRTVSLPVAVAAKAILDGRIKLTGVQRPVVPELYNLILGEMEKLNVVFKEETLPPHLWLRHEVKPGEERVAATPENVGKLLAAGYRVSVEESKTRCFPDSDYAALGCTMVPSESWQKAPSSAIIFGLKELPDNDDPLEHRHIYFAHCYKNQGGWDQILKKFINGSGLLWDLEFLVDDNGRRVAAFGRAAGLVGMALALLTWAYQKQGKELKNLTSWKQTSLLVAEVKAEVETARKVANLPESEPSALVIGALGRCGGGAVWFAEQCGVSPVKWDMAETKAGGPFKQLLDQSILVNCIYLSAKINPFLTPEMVAGERKLSVFCDVSCDTTNPNNPFPIYHDATDLVNPILRTIDGDNPLDVIAIDHLPTLVPVDSSNEFSTALLPHVIDWKNGKTPVWDRAEVLFEDKKKLVK
eukprot:CAMPEP_0175161518 /NCGR_PEP_ID=MMETSP0087-20121206/24651_1 /TAXON_ID=136419 /ORGANISM="Unknown Unknown, Strain D1" /LENGTH=799 /DNA_ID=CAMNT_0016449945 /DNA_START=37 /DNA_END=2436 /DNA_ORIENTATION=+